MIYLCTKYWMLNLINSEAPQDWGPRVQDLCVDVYVMEWWTYIKLFKIYYFRYDPKTDTWTLVTPISSPRDAVGVCLLGDKIYAVGGYDGQQYLNDVECYDPQSNEWSKVSPTSRFKAYSHHEKAVAKKNKHKDLRIRKHSSRMRTAHLGGHH